MGNVRKVNEDSTLNAPESGIWAVADGMGGHSAGDVASQLIVSALSALPQHNNLALTVGEIEEALVNVNTQLMLLAESESGKRVIGSTVVVLAVLEQVVAEQDHTQHLVGTAQQVEGEFRAAIPLACHVAKSVAVRRHHRGFGHGKEGGTAQQQRQRDELRR